MSTRYVWLFMLLASASACGGSAVAPVTPKVTSPATAERPSPTQTMAASTATPQPPEATAMPTEATGPAPAGPAPKSVPPTLALGFTTTFVPLPEGFPIPPDAQFIAYNPAYDPCLSGERDCAPGRISEQVWLYQVELPALAMGPAAPHVLVASRYTEVLAPAGFQVEQQVSQGMTTLVVANTSRTPALRATILIGPPVSDHLSAKASKPPADRLLIGIRISIENDKP
jgi:hypothetical protein